MKKMLLLGAVFTVASVGAAFADMPMTPMKVAPGIERATMQCGRGFWQGPGAKCYPTVHGGTCPAGFHRRGNTRCWPNT
jgi:hypothetical protein